MVHLIAHFLSLGSFINHPLMVLTGIQCDRLCNSRVIDFYSTRGNKECRMLNAINGKEIFFVPS